MVQLKFLSFFVLLIASKADDSDLSGEESKKVILKTKVKARLGASKPFQCDLVLMSEQKELMFSESRLIKTEVSFDSYNWPKTNTGHVIVPYHISRSSHYSSEQARLMRSSMDQIESSTCIRFIPRTHEPDFVNIHSGQYCKSNLGKTGGGQEMSLNKNTCMEKGIIMHELLHALGYIHMHSRPDRDKYVSIAWKNIKPMWYKEFAKVNPSVFNYYGTPYDYHSIMHYNSLAFSANGKPTIVPKDSGYTDIIGQRHGLSEGDIKRINMKYKCNVDKSSFFGQITPYVKSPSIVPYKTLYSKPEYNIISKAKKPAVETFSKYSSGLTSFGSGLGSGLGNYKTDVSSISSSSLGSFKSSGLSGYKTESFGSYKPSGIGSFPVDDGFRPSVGPSTITYTSKVNKQPEVDELDELFNLK